MMADMTTWKSGTFPVVGRSFDNGDKFGLPRIGNQALEKVLDAASTGSRAPRLHCGLV